MRASILSLLLPLLLAVPLPLSAFPFEDMTAETVYITTSDGHCSGVVVSSWQVVTAGHCVRESKAWTVRFSDGTERTARPIWASPTRDVAALGVSVPPGVPFARPDCRAARLGEAVSVVGFPLELGMTVTQGHVISLPTNAATNRWAVVIDAVVNPGNSGGPLFAADGRLLGIVFGYNPAARYGAAVPLADFCADLAETHT